MLIWLPRKQNKRVHDEDLGGRSPYSLRRIAHSPHAPLTARSDAPKDAVAEEFLLKSALDCGQLECQ